CRFLPGGEITYVNDAYCRYFDKTTEALEGSNFLMLIPKEYWEIVMSNINSLTMDMPTQSHEHQVITPDGQHHWQRWVNRALFNQEGKITAYQSMGEDITGRKQAEASLIESEAKYRSIFQSTGVGMIVVIDGNGDIEEWNVGAERAFGYSSAEVAGKPLTMLMPERYREAHTKGFAWAREQGGLAHSGVTHQVHGLRKDGEEFSLELTLGSWKRDGDIFFSAIILDITKRKRAEEKVHTLSQAIEQSPVSVIITDPKANIVFVNNTFEQVTGYSSAEVIGQNPSILKSGKTSPGRYSDLWLAITNGKTWRGEFQNCRKNGEIFWEQAQIAPVLNESGATVHYLAVKEDISHRKQQEERILHQAHFDMLTGLPNRFLSLDRLSQQLNEAQRTNERVAVLFLDLDDFKKINDALGHEMGDKLLIEAARRLSSVVRSGDTVGRLGGDEFIVLLGGLTDAADASPVVENLLNRFRDAFSVDGRELILTASVGIAAYPDDGDTPSELLRNADSAMYYSKKQGRNTYSYFTNAMNFGVSQRLLLEEQLHGALDRGEFRLCYQPLVDVDGTGIIGVEALLRWNNPALGEVSPTEFIPIAEQTGLIVSLGEFVLTEALATVVEWQQKHQRQFLIAINLSPRQFRNPNLVPYNEQTIQKTGIPGASLEMEITQGVLMSGHDYI
ncbi:MAG: PAS domain S-box protein, partial [Gammaproteobacteria bacterium]|nr:PAS domain S-box protein [Gammaproteobacteria bacterium]